LLQFEDVDDTDELLNEELGLLRKELESFEISELESSTDMSGDSVLPSSSKCNVCAVLVDACIAHTILQ